MAGNKNSGRKKIDENTAEIKRRLAEIAVKGMPYLFEVADGKEKNPSRHRLDVIQEAIDHTIGKPPTSVDLSGPIPVTPIKDIVYHMDTGDGEQDVPRPESEASDNQAESTEVEGKPS